MTRIFLVSAFTVSILTLSFAAASAGSSSAAPRPVFQGTTLPMIYD